MIFLLRERKRERERETERLRDRETERQRDRETERQRQRHREREYRRKVGGAALSFISHLIIHKRNDNVTRHN